jgi:O-antigen ligase
LSETSIIKAAIKALSLKEKLQLAGTCLFVATLPFAREINQVFMGIFLFTCALCWNKESWTRNKKTILIFTSVYLVAIFSSLYDPDKLLAYQKLEVQSTLLLVPLLFGASYTPNRFKNNTIQIAFITGVCAALLYLVVYFVFHMRALQIPVSGWLKGQYLNHQYSAPIGIHAGYFSAYVSLCLFFLIIFLVSYKSRVIKTVILLLIVLCFISLFLLTSRSILLLTTVCLICFVPLSFKRWKWHFSLLSVIAISVLLFFFFTKSNYFQERFTGDLEKDVKLSELAKAAEDGHSPAKETILKNDGARIERWVAAIELIKKRPLLGYGTGEEKPELFKKYKEMGLTVTLEQHYDSHNQFISFTIKSGVLGFIAFTWMLLYAFTHAIKNRNYIYISFLILVAGTCLIDTFLEVNKGIFFYTFFNIFLFVTMKPRLAPPKEIPSPALSPAM